jgi:cell fate regulator YaaT (PSP1 superfamily)
MTGGISICGRPLCCHTYLSDFAPVSIKMAKEQNLSLNPTKISGVCGRLMCCLQNEQETYEYLNSKLPGVGDTVEIKEEKLKGEVQSVGVLRQKVKVLVESNGEKELREYPVSALSFHKKKRYDKMNVNDSELKKLEALERQEGKSKIDD